MPPGRSQFALALGAGPVQIGILATLPFGLRLSQLVMSTRLERLGRWRAVALAGGLAGRIALLAGLLTRLLPAGEARLWLLVGVVATARRIPSYHRLPRCASGSARRLSTGVSTGSPASACSGGSPSTSRRRSSRRWSFPFEPFLHYVYTPAARVADYIAPEPGARAGRRHGDRRASDSQP